MKEEKRTFTIAEVTFEKGIKSKFELRAKGLRESFARNVIKTIADEKKGCLCVFRWYNEVKQIEGCYMAVGSQKVVGYFVCIGNTIESLCISNPTAEILDHVRMLSRDAEPNIGEVPFDLQESLSELYAMRFMGRLKIREMCEKYLNSIDDIQVGDIISGYELDTKRTIKVTAKKHYHLTDGAFGETFGTDLGDFGWGYDGVIITPKGKESKAKYNKCSLSQNHVETVNGNLYNNKVNGGFLKLLEKMYDRLNK